MRRFDGESVKCDPPYFFSVRTPARSRDPLPSSDLGISQSRPDNRGGISGRRASLAVLIPPSGRRYPYLIAEDVGEVRLAVEAKIQSHFNEWVVGQLEHLLRANDLAVQDIGTWRVSGVSLERGRKTAAGT
ncbi:hypothetical protein D3C80_1498330 [compost metagenome]